MGGNNIGTWAIFVVGSIIVLLIGINIGGEVTGTVTDSLAECQGNSDPGETNYVKRPSEFCVPNGSGSSAQWIEAGGIITLGKTILSFFPVLYYSSLFAIPGAIGMMLYKKMNV